MIQPTVGRVVWFYKWVDGQGHKGPMAAHVAFVHSPQMVNLMVIDEQGVPRSQTSVTLNHDESGAVPESDYCAWMPYQKGQAAKTESLEAKLGEKS
jgi:hypothetical protein